MEKIKFEQVALPSIPILRARLPDRIIDKIWEMIRNIRQEDKISDLPAGDISSTFSLNDTEGIFKSITFPLAQVLMENPGSIHGSLGRWGVSGYYSGKKELVISDLWVNFQKKHGLNPWYTHSGIFSFVLWLKIPYESEEQDIVPHVGHANANRAGCFVINVIDPCGGVHDMPVATDYRNENQILFFPAQLPRQVYFGTDEKRVSVSGNISVVEYER